MKALLTLFDGTVYRFSTKTEAASDGLYEGRISEELSFLSMTSENGATPAEQNITIRNEDNFIPSSKNLWGAELSLTSELGQVWRGKVTFYNFDGDGNLYITASEKGAPELETELPDEVRQVYSIDENFHQSSTTMTIPLVVGGSHANPLLIPGILIDKTQGIYLLCTGEIREIVNVYSGSEKLNTSDYTACTGTASQAEHKGFAYVKIAENKRQNLDGTYAEINAEVVGLKLGTHTESECRNGARFLYYLLTTPATGINGWGCGIPTSEIDQTSFNYAIQLCDTFQYRLDGIMWLRQSAQSWIDQICQAIHGTYSMNSDGKRALTIDYAAATSKRTFGADDMVVSRYGRNAYTGQVYNKGILSYGYNPVTGLFMQSAQYHNEQSIDQIGEQKFVGESYLINDAATALAVLEYTCKKSQAQSESIEFTTDRLETPLAAGDLITIDRPDIDIQGVWQISSISTSETLNTITAKRFDTSVFTVSGTHSNVNWTNEKPIEPALTPAQATDLILTSGFDINPDGTGNCFINGTFTLPAGGWLAAAVQYGEGTTPTRWIDAALITDNNFKIVPVSVGTVYSVRIRMITATGHSDYITGQITTTGDNIAPNVPTIAVNATDKSVIIQCAVEQPPYDMGGFQIYRKKHSESVYSYIGSVAANGGYASYSDYVPEFVQYDYKAKSYDRSGNLSDFSAEKTIMVTGVEANELAATALKIPTGSILNINAKGCTTESIKTAGGVIDGSGFGHHGQAYGGVSVLDGGEGFSFDGVNGSHIIYPNILAGLTEVTVYIEFSMDELPTEGENRRLFMAYTSPYIDLGVDSNFSGRIGMYINSGRAPASLASYGEFVPGKTYKVALTADFTNRKGISYVNGEKVVEYDCGTGTTTGAASIHSIGSFVGQPNTTFNGQIKAVRIYPRALSAVEVKSLYMIPQEAVLTRVTADVIGANAVNAIHMNANSVTTNAIAAGAVVADKIGANAVTSDKINAGAITADKIGANAVTSDKINAGAITADKISVSVLPKGATMHLSTAGMSGKTYYNIPDVSGNGHIAKQVGSVPITTFSSTTEPNATGDYTFVIPTATSNYIETDYRPITTRMKNFSIVFTSPGLDAINSANQYSRLIVGQGSDYNGFGFGINNGTHWGALYRARGGGDQNLYLISFGTGSIGWFHAAITFTVSGTSVTMKAYKNGVLLGTQVINSLDFSNSLNNFSSHRCQFLGGLNSPYFARERLCNIRTYERVLTADEVMALYKAGTDTESGQITADRIATDAIKSRNYSEPTSTTTPFSVAGTFLDLANGAITSKNFCIKSDGSATFKGALSGATGSFSGNVTANSGKIGAMTISSDGGLVCNSTSSTVFPRVILANAYSNYSVGTNLLHNGLTILETSGTANRAASVHAGLIESTAANTSELALQVTGKVSVNGTIVHGSDRNIKSDIRQTSTLNKLKQLNVYSWKYDEDKLATKNGEKPKGIGAKNNALQIGPMAQDFNSIFGTNKGSQDYISYTDTIGVALRAIQELSSQLDNAVREIRRLKRIFRTNGTITDEIIAEDRDNEAIRRLEIAKARQAKRAIKEHESPLDVEVIEDVEINNVTR